VPGPRLIADRGAWVKEDRPDVVLDQLLFDFPYQLPPMSAKSQTEKDRRSRSTAGQPLTADLFTNKPTQLVSAKS
jgi:hypothetical protein